jgi:hypothetical protein
MVLFDLGLATGLMYTIFGNMYNYVKNKDYIKKNIQEIPSGTNILEIYSYKTNISLPTFINTGHPGIMVPIGGGLNNKEYKIYTLLQNKGKNTMINTENEIITITDFQPNISYINNKNDLHKLYTKYNASADSRSRTRWSPRGPTSRRAQPAQKRPRRPSSRAISSKAPALCSTSFPVSYPLKVYETTITQPIYYNHYYYFNYNKSSVINNTFLKQRKPFTFIILGFCLTIIAFDWYDWYTYKKDYKYYNKWQDYPIFHPKRFIQYSIQNVLSNSSSKPL